MSENNTTTIQASADVIKTAVGAMSASPMCLAVLILSCASMVLGYLAVQHDIDRRSKSFDVVIERCFPLQGHEKN